MLVQIESSSCLVVSVVLVEVHWTLMTDLVDLMPGPLNKVLISCTFTPSEFGSTYPPVRGWRGPKAAPRGGQESKIHLPTVHSHCRSKGGDFFVISLLPCLKRRRLQSLIQSYSSAFKCPYISTVPFFYNPILTKIWLI